MNFWFDLAVSVILSTLKEVVKNKERKDELRRAMLKVKNGIDAVYAEPAE